MPKQRPASWIRSIATMVLALVLVGETIGFSLYTYADVEQKLEPKRLVDTAEQTIRRRYPQLRRQLVEEIRDHAPEIAARASKEAVASSPELRQWLERVTARQLEVGLDEATELSADEFRTFLRNNHDEVRRALEQIDAAPEKADKLVLRFEERLDGQFGIDIRKDAKRALELQQRLNTKLERLAGNGPLEPKELLERRIVRILRAMQQEELQELGLADR